MQASKHLGILAISLSLMFGATSCATPEPAPSDPAATTSFDSTPSIPAENRVPQSYVGVAMESPDAENRVTIEDGELIVDNERALSLTSHGTVDTIPNNRAGESPASDDEVFHVITYDIIGSQGEDWVDRNDPLNQAQVSINGELMSDELLLADGSSAILVSAPEDAELFLEVATDGIAQQIDLRTGERLSKGIAEAWYTSDSAKIEGREVKETVTEDGATGTLSYAYNQAVAKTPWTEHYGWADEGKSAWVIVNIDQQPTWELAGDGSVSVPDEDHQWTLLDEAGNEYSPDEELIADYILRFKVPAEGNTYTLKTSITDTITSIGETIAVFGPVENDATITFG